MEELIIDYLSGSAKGKDIDLLREWLEKSEENKRIFDEISDIWDATYSEKQKFDIHTGLHKVKKQIWADKSEKSQVSVGSKKLGKYYPMAMRVAAIFIIALITGILILNHKYNSLKFASEQTFSEIAAPEGSKSKVVLPDGTRVWLNAGSKIRYNGAFNRNNRKVSIEGEAYFDVIKNKQLPFLVVTSDVTIRVTGTAFNIKAYPKEGSVETTLVRGSLIVEQKSSNRKLTETILSPNQRATFVKQSGKLFLSDVDKQVLQKENIESPDKVKGTVLVAKEVDTETFTAWKDNRLVFRNETFESLVVKLERWYGVKINITDNEIKDYHFNGTIENETINDVMEIIRYTLPIRYTISHNTITIRK